MCDFNLIINIFILTSQVPKIYILLGINKTTSFYVIWFYNAVGKISPED